MAIFLPYSVSNEDTENRENKKNLQSVCCKIALDIDTESLTIKDTEINKERTQPKSS